MAMNYDEFLEFAKNETRAAIPDAVVKSQQVDKLQGESYTGLSVRPEGSNAAVTMNLNNAFERYQEQPGSLTSLMDKVISDVRAALSQIPQVDTTQLGDYSKVKDQLIMQVIPVEPNAEMLENLPHKTVEDIAVVYRIDVSDSRHHDASILITNQMMDQFGITSEQLHQDAVLSQTEHRAPTLKNMSEMMAEMSGGFMEMEESPMWVATVEGGVNGAAVVQIPAFMDEAAEKLGGDFFVLPSSVHECLFIRDDGAFDREQLESMVQNVNATEVSPADFLSDSVYHYDADERIFEKAVTFEARVAEQAIAYETTTPEVSAETITVLLVEPEKYPRPVEIGTDLADLQKAVGGYIEVTYPFDDNVGLIMNEEGKIDGLPLNRALRDENGGIYDVVAGSFLVAGLTDDGFGSLTPDQMKKFEEKFHQPEVFLRMWKGLMALPLPMETMQKREEKAAEKTAGRAKREEKPLKKVKKAKEEAL